MFNNLLEGTKVLELASVLAGPSVGMFLAELGAEVLKVENPNEGGDVTRSWRLKNEEFNDGRSAYFCSVNWGKESILIDLKKSKQKKELLKLISITDVLICSFKYSDAKKFGLNYDELKEINSSLIQINITGFSNQPKRVGYDAVVQAESGWWYMNGEKNKSGHKIPVALVDVLAAHQAKEAVLAALIYREKNNGKGCELTVSLMDSALAALVNQASNYLVAGHDPKPIGSEHPNIVPYGSTFMCKDGIEIMLAIGSDKQFASLCHILKISPSPDFESNKIRVKNKSAVLKFLARAIKKHKSSILYLELEQNFIPAGIVKPVSKALEEAPMHMILNDVDSGIKGVRSVVFANRKDLKAPPTLPTK